MENAQTPSPRLLRGPAAYVPRTPWRPGTALLAACLIIGLAVLGAVLAVGVASVADAPTDVARRWWRPAGADAAVLAMLGIWQALTVAMTLAASAVFGGRLRNVLALGAPAGGASTYWKAIALMVGLQVVVTAVQHAASTQDMFADLRPFAKLVGGPEWSLAFLVVGIGAPLSEELLFRGFLLSALAQSRLGFAGAALLTTALWTGLHAGYSAAGIAEVFLIGLFFSWLLWRTGSLRVPLFCHALYNSAIMVLLRHVQLPV